MRFPEKPRPSPLTRLLLAALVATMALVAVHAFQIRELRGLIRQQEVEPMRNASEVETVPLPFYVEPDARAGRVL